MPENFCVYVRQCNVVVWFLVMVYKDSSYKDNSNTINWIEQMAMKALAK